MVATATRSGSPDDMFWPRSTGLFLGLIGLLLAVMSFAVVMSVPDLPWDSSRDSELRATYDAFGETGILLIAADGSEDGAWRAAHVEGAPGAFVVASLVGHAVGAESPYPGLRLVQALLVALPLLWLPTAVARIFRRARAGYAMVLLPALVWLVNNGTILVGTEYGLSDEVAEARVDAFSGIGASWVFLSLSLLLLLSTRRRGRAQLVVITLATAVLAGVSSLFLPFSGIGIAAAVAAVWWLNSPRRWRWLIALAAAAVTALLGAGLQVGMTSVLQNGTTSAVSAPAVPTAAADHWEALYLGLAWPEPVTGAPSPFGVVHADGFAIAQVREVDPDVVIGSDAYAAILESLYNDAVASDPAGAFRLYVEKTLFVVKQFGAMIIVIILGFVMALTRRSPQRRPLTASLAIAAPTIVLGFAPPVMGIPTAALYSQLSAALGMLSAVALGALVWSITSMPSHVRSLERTRLSGRERVTTPEQTHRPALSVVVPTRNGAEVLPETLASLGAVLGSDAEIIVVENGSTDDTVAVLVRIEEAWRARPALVTTTSEPGLGEALRSGLLASNGRRVLLTADDLPFGFTDLDRFRDLSGDVVVAIGSKAHPDSQVQRGWRRTVQSSIFRFLRQALLQSRVGDSQGTIWVDGDWGREFARLSRESGLMGTTELVLAAEQQGFAVHEVPVVLAERHAGVSSRFRFRDAWESVIGFTRLAVYKDDYCNEKWARSTHASEPSSELIPLADAPKPRDRP